jgi:hypothetical protein
MSNTSYFQVKNGKVQIIGVRVAIRAFPFGDFDEDLDVDGYDFLEWQQGCGDIYDASDLANFGAAGPAVAALNIPEPTTSVLAFAALLLAFGRRLTC